LTRTPIKKPAARRKPRPVQSRASELDVPRQGRRGLSRFAQAVRRIVLGIPRGRTLSYGEIAFRAGKPGGARAVVSALHRIDDVPWWRVVRSDGTLAPAVAHQQSQLLRSEGWKPRPPSRRAQPRSSRLG
jgi:methylated-DNA-protein-cysteine methyltransferase-like protein